MTIERPTRTCSKCNIFKQPDEFYMKSSSVNVCKECHRNAVRKHVENNRLSINRKAERWRFKHRYGITLEDYVYLYELQKGKCAICSIEHTVESRNLHVDHCHDSKKVRGLLCRQCNHAIGLLKDNPVSLLNAYNYLQNNQS